MKLKSITGALAFVVALGAAFAFTPKSAVKVAAKSPNDVVWVKFSCINNSVQIVSGGNTTTDLSTGIFGTECNGTTSHVCARQYNTTDLIPIAGQPNNFQPKTGAVVLDTDFCQ